MPTRPQPEDLNMHAVRQLGYPPQACLTSLPAAPLPAHHLPNMMHVTRPCLLSHPPCCCNPSAPPGHPHPSIPQGLQLRGAPQWLSQPPRNNLILPPSPPPRACSRGAPYRPPLPPRNTASSSSTVRRMRRASVPGTSPLSRWEGEGAGA